MKSFSVEKESFLPFTKCKACPAPGRPRLPSAEKHSARVCVENLPLFDTEGLKPSDIHYWCCSCLMGFLCCQSSFVAGQISRGIILSVCLGIWQKGQNYVFPSPPFSGRFKPSLFKDNTVTFVLLSSKSKTNSEELIILTSFACVDKACFVITPLFILLPSKNC